MMLRALYDLAEREGLLDDPDFERHRVDLRIRLAPNGTLLALDQVSDGRDVLTSAVPRVPKRAGFAVRPGLLFDVSGYVLGAGKDADRRAASFRELTERVARLTNDAGVRAVALFVGDTAGMSAALGRRAEWTGGEWVAFTLEGDGAAFVHERPAARAYWTSQRKNTKGASARQRCLITGDITEPVRLHGSVRMPGTKGATLVSFNEPSSCLAGLEQGSNAPVSRAAAEGYVTALNWMLERVGERKHRQAVSFGDGNVLVYWTREAHGIVDLVPVLLDDVAELVGAPWRTGAPLGRIESTAFYAVSLGTNRTRIVVRDWLETTVTSLSTSLDAYAAHLRLDGDDERVPTLGALLRAAGDVAPSMGPRLFRAAFKGAPFPRELLAAALRALCSSSDGVPLRTRCALIKAVLMRLPRAGSAGIEIRVSLDESNNDVAYLLGRLFAVLEQMQWAAHGATVNATVRDRYYRAAASTPAMVFPRLLDLSAHHATKIARRGRGSYLESTKAGIIDALPALPFPRTMRLEHQGLFAIGYYHQRQRLFQRPAGATPDVPAPRPEAEPAPAPRDPPRRTTPEQKPRVATAKTRRGKAPAQERRARPKMRSTREET